MANVLTPEKYGMFPTTAAVLVERPPKVKAPVDELYESGKVAERELLLILLLNVVQSALERQPKVEPFAVLQVTAPSA